MKLTVLGHNELALTTVKWTNGVVVSTINYDKVNWVQRVDYDGVGYDVLR